MSLPMLVVDNDNEFSLREQVAWQKHDIFTVRVDNMQEAIEKLSKKSFFFVAINADSINYLPLLRIMSDISTSPILIGVSEFTHEKQIEAFANGALWYSQLQDDPEKNVQSALSFLQSLHSREKFVNRTPRIVARGNLTAYIDYYKVFCNDAEVVLTPKEYSLLCCLLNNPNITLTFEKLARKVWKAEVVSNNAMWQVIHRLNNKLNNVGFNGGDIINFRGVGYRFMTQPDT